MVKRSLAGCRILRVSAPPGRNLRISHQPSFGHGRNRAGDTLPRLPGHARPRHPRQILLCDPGPPLHSGRPAAPPSAAAPSRSPGPPPWCSSGPATVVSRDETRGAWQVHFHSPAFPGAACHWTSQCTVNSTVYEHLSLLQESWNC